MLVLKLRCRCGAIQSASTAEFGREMTCVQCGAFALVPVPKETQIREYLERQLPLSMPGCSLNEYREQYRRIQEMTLSTLESLKEKSFLFEICIDEMIDRMMRLKSFVVDIQKESANTEAVDRISSLAAGFTFAGFGQREGNLANHMKWRDAAPTVEPLARQLQTELERLREIRRTQKSDR